METMEFNLLREPWIRVMKEDCSISEKSLTDVLVQAHTFQRLAGELPTQDYAILRLLLAILLTVFERADENGEEAMLETEQEALLRWKALWQRGSFPAEAIKSYLNRYENRFWLFHPETPFYQVPAAIKGTEYAAGKLIGEVSRSGNKEKLRLMLNRQADGASYSEAARWLISINGFDDASTKVWRARETAWLGRLGNIYAEGDTLFQTLMLNMVMLKDGKELWEEPNQPIWEKPQITKISEKKVLPRKTAPENFAELLTLQSRLLLLHRENGIVTGYNGARGDDFKELSAVAEQMTIWCHKTDKKGIILSEFVPATHSSGRQVWRDFKKIFSFSEKMTGVVSWVQNLERKHYIERGTVHFRTVGVCYDSKGSSAVEIISDHLDFRANLLDELGESWVRMVEKQILIIEQAAKTIDKLTEALVKASGRDGEEAKNKNKKRDIEMEYYSRIDIPFREWLLSLNPQKGDEAKIEAESAWRKIGYAITISFGKDLAVQAGNAAFVGREIYEKENRKEVKKYYCTPKALNEFVADTRQIFEIAKAKEGDKSDAC